jgi:hypothetical protein
VACQQVLALGKPCTDVWLCMAGLRTLNIEVFQGWLVMNELRAESHFLSSVFFFLFVNLKLSLEAYTSILTGIDRIT